MVSQYFTLSSCEVHLARKQFRLKSKVQSIRVASRVSLVLNLVPGPQRSGEEDQGSIKGFFNMQDRPQGTPYVLQKVGLLMSHDQCI
jgi:hypothetical protein